MVIIGFACYRISQVRKDLRDQVKPITLLPIFLTLLPRAQYLQLNG